MSLFTDLKEVFTAYAQRIKGLAAADEEIKADLTQTTGNTFIPLTATGKYINLSGSTADITSPTNSSGSEYLVAECVAGDTFTITANGAASSNGRAVGFCQVMELF